MKNPPVPAPLSAGLFSLEAGQTAVLTGAGAAARGAFEAGVALVTSYPGSPITEVFDLLSTGDHPARPVCHLAVNEHVAFHKAMGFALAGGRALVTMKHVGFNVASDPAHYIGYTGVVGGMVVLVGTDPGATCSTGEFDFRFYALHTHLPLLEPVSGQSALDLVRNAFTWSEQDSLPYVVALPAGTCYGIEGVYAGKAVARRSGSGFQASPHLTNVGRRAVENHRLLLEKTAAVAERAGNRGLEITHGTGRGTLIVTSGINFPRVVESLDLLGLADLATVWCPLLTHPLPTEALTPLLKRARRVIFVEDLGGFLQLQLAPVLQASGRKLEVLGKGTSPADLFPPYGNLDLDLVKTGLARAFGQRRPRSPPRPALEIPEREGTFCPGCAYRPFFHVLTEALGPDGVLGGDIGCSSLPPHFSSWLTCMNSGTSIAAGVSLAVAGRQQVVSLIGDSTLLHSGLQTILEAAHYDSDQVCFVLDNSWTAMTGHQPTPATPTGPAGEPRPHLDLEQILRSLGVKRIDRGDPFLVGNFRSLVKRVLREKGFRVVIVERECTLQARRRPFKPGWQAVPRIETERCHQCGTCYESFNCPAIVRTTGDDLAIDDEICARCGVCAQICGNAAIVTLKVRR